MRPLDIGGGAHATHIRKATLADLPALERVDALALSAQDRFERTALRRLLRSKTDIVIVAVHDGAIAGFAAVSRNSRDCWLKGLAVLPRCRRMGIGRQLVMSVLRRTEREDRAIKLAVRADNIAAQLLYDGLGFTACGVRERYYPDGAAGLMFVAGASVPQAGNGRQ
ncbi:MAG: GNAT family N-acetyltransferase [Planctomycetes bacterium]|nr:GNAT family N-acetyltransferase [Planctomycetota bacterium]